MKSIPYQRIEYLESKDELFDIDTKFVIPQGADNRCEVKFYVIARIVGQTNYIFSNNQKFSHTYRLYISSSSNPKIGSTFGRVNSNNTDFEFSNVDETMFESILTNDVFILNNLSKTTYGALTSNINESSIHLFNLPTDTTLGLVGRIYYFRWYNKDKLLLDLLPVRIGDVGYMYDKVSGQLFGNSGEGKFILGPDI